MADMIPADLAAFRALMERAHNVASDRCIGPRCCGDLCESLHALATATPAQLCGMLGDAECAADWEHTALYHVIVRKDTTRDGEG